MWRKIRWHKRVSWTFDETNLLFKAENVLNVQFHIYNVGHDIVLKKH